MTASILLSSLAFSALALLSFRWQPFDAAKVLRELEGKAKKLGYWTAQVRDQIHFFVTQRDMERIEFFNNFFDKEMAARGLTIEPFDPDPDPGEADQGEIHWGDTRLGPEVREPIDDGKFNVIFSGPPGSGKSIGILRYVEQLIEHDVRCWIWDTEAEYTGLARRFGSAVLDVIDFRDDPDNVFQGPDNIAQRDWVLGILTNTLAESCYWGDKTINLFRVICLQLYESGVDFINTENFIDQYDQVPKSKQYLPEYGSLERFVTTLRSYPNFRCARGESTTDAQQRNRIIICREIPNDLLRFKVINSGNRVMYSRPDSMPFNLCYIFDEATRFFSRSTLAAWVSRNESAYLQMLRGGRHRGLGVVLGEQLYSGLHPLARATCQTKIIFQTDDGASRQEIARDLGLTKEQQDFLAQLSYKRERSAVIKMRRRPFSILTQVPEYQKPAPLTDVELQARRKDAVARMKWEPLPETKTVANVALDFTILEDRYEKVLRPAVAKPFKAMWEHGADLKMPPATLSKYADELESMGMVKREVIKLYGMGKDITLLWPTDNGFQYINRRGGDYTNVPGNGSPQHRCYQHWIREYESADGGIVKVEYDHDGKRVDVGVARGDERIAYEVEIESPFKTGPINLSKDIDAGWTKIVFVVESEEIKERLSHIIDGQLAAFEKQLADRRLDIKLPQVTILLLKEFVPKRYWKADKRNNAIPARAKN